MKQFYFSFNIVLILLFGPVVSSTLCAQKGLNLQMEPQDGVPLIKHIGNELEMDDCGVSLVDANNGILPTCMANLNTYDFITTNAYSSNNALVSALAAYLQNGGNLLLTVDPMEIGPSPQLPDMQATINGLLNAIGQGNITLNTSTFQSNNAATSISVGSVPYSCPLENVGYAPPSSFVGLDIGGGYLTGAGLTNATTISINPGVIQAYWDTGFGGILGVATENISGGRGTGRTPPWGLRGARMIWNFMNPNGYCINAQPCDDPIFDYPSKKQTNAGCGLSNGSIQNLNIVGLTGSSTYAWTNSAGTVVGNTLNISNLAPDDYTLTVTNGGCTFISEIITIYEIGCPEPCLGANLVPNPSFEDPKGNNCATGYLQASNPVQQYFQNWFKGVGGTSDVFSTCGGDNSLLGVPENATGYQKAKFEGNNYVGIIANLNANGPYSETVGVRLSQKLQVGKQYRVQYYVSLAEIYSDAAVDGMGVLFTAGSPLTDNRAHVATYHGIIPQLVNPPGNFLEDTKNWTLLQWYYTADGTEEYITIGNFYTGATRVKLLDPTATMSINSQGDPKVNSYYYMDEVSIQEVLTPLPVDESALSLNNPDCNATNGNITGLAVPGVSPSAIYSWVDASGTQVGTSLDLTGVGTGDYSLTVNDNGCIGTAGPYTLVENGAPIIDDSGVNIAYACNAPNNGSISNIMVSNISGSATYTWRDDTNTQVGNTLDIQNLSVGLYWLTVTEGVCSTTLGPYQIKEESLTGTDGTMQITDATCGNSDGRIRNIFVPLFGPTSRTYVWTNQVGQEVSTSTTSAFLFNVPSGTYTLTVTNVIGGCSITMGPYTVGDDCSCSLSLNTASISTKDTDCGQSNGSITGITASGVSGGETYSWTDASGTLVGPSIDLMGVGAGDYTLSVSEVGCTPASVGPFTIGQNGGGTVDAGNNITINSGENTTLAATPSTGSPTYTWSASPLDASLSGQENMQNPIVSPTQPTTYTVTADFGGGCITTDTVTVVVIDPSCPLVLDDSSSVVSNADCGIANGSITGITVTGDSGNETYSWTDIQGTMVGNQLNLLGVGPGIYSLTVAQGACTTTSGPYTLIEEGAPVLNDNNIDLINADCNASNGSISGITISGNSGNEIYEWSDQNGSVVGTSLLLNGIGSGSYTLRVTDQGCSAFIGPYTIEEVDNCQEPEPSSIRIATAMTPNGDGSNDMFMIAGLENYPNNRLFVFNRWGNKVYEASNYQNDWFGNYQNNPLPVAAYYYILELNDPDKQIFKGTITIIR